MFAHVRNVALSLLVAACGEALGPSAEPQSAEEAAPLVHAAASDAARAAGSLTIQRGGLVFANGATLYTRQLTPRSALDPIASSGESFGEAAGMFAGGVDLRRVTQQEGGRVCGDGEPGFVAIMREQRQVRVLVFAGDEPPGPNASPGAVCALFAYSAPSASPL